MRNGAGREEIDDRTDDRRRRGRVVAWRFWDLTEADDRVLLQSPFRRVAWPVGEPLRAACLGVELPGSTGRRAHQAPGESCRCGVYGSTYRELRLYLRANIGRGAPACVLGRVVLFGHIVQDEPGWRASHAYPETLLVPTFTRGAFAVAESLEAYGVRVSVLDAGETFAALNSATPLRAVR